MKQSELVTYPDKRLREVTQKVTSFNDDLKSQIAEMAKTLRSYGGIGLAANQMGYDNRVILAEFKNETGEEEIPFTAFINPEIIELTQEKETCEEGCLSVPGIWLDVNRPVGIKLKYYDQQGKKHKIAPKGILSRVLQHEIDHLNGILFTDRVKEKLLESLPDLNKINIVFWGSGPFASHILEGLGPLELNLKVVTEKAKPAGRGQKPAQTAVAKTAQKLNLPYAEVDKLEEILKFDQMDLLICADFGQKIPLNVLGSAKISAINIHPSLLPKYQGATPIQSAILAGEKETGVSIIRMSEKIDQGPILAQAKVEILDFDDAISLRERLATLALKLLIEILPPLIKGDLLEKAQDLTRSTKTQKLTKDQGLIDWDKKPQEIDRQIRGLYPWPGTFTFIDNKRLKIHEAHFEENQLVLDIVQLEGKNPVTRHEFLNGWRGPTPEWFKKIKVSQ